MVELSFLRSKAVLRQWYYSKLDLQRRYYSEEDMSRYYSTIELRRLEEWCWLASSHYFVWLYLQKQRQRQRQHCGPLVVPRLRLVLSHAASCLAVPSTTTISTAADATIPSSASSWRTVITSPASATAMGRIIETIVLLLML